MKAAAFVLMTGSLRKILDVLGLAAKTAQIVRQDLFWAFLYEGRGY
jgi:cation transport ATPase